MRKIYCYKCQCLVGEVRDAKLKKDLLFLCKDCYDKETYRKNNNKPFDCPPGFEDLFGSFVK